MLTKPLITDETIRAGIEKAYNIAVNQLIFLPIGADFNTAVYRLTTQNTADFFLKLRQQAFSKASVLLPKYLADHGAEWIIAPIANLTGQLWTKLGSCKAILYPYVDGAHGIEKTLSEQHWRTLGSAMRELHGSILPATITQGIPKDSFPTESLKTVQKYLARFEQETFLDPIAKELVLFLQSQQKFLVTLLEKAAMLAQQLQNQAHDYVLCHGDIHAWNILISQDDKLYIVDWDTLLFAPKERDLMFVGAGIGATGRPAREEQRLFYQGYGNTEVNHDAIAYYRFERILQDIAEYCDHILEGPHHPKARAQSLTYLKSNFLEDGTIARTFQDYRQG